MAPLAIQGYRLMWAPEWTALRNESFPCQRRADCIPSNELPPNGSESRDGETDSGGHVCLLGRKGGA
jgi:hypothetical protein